MDCAEVSAVKESYKTITTHFCNDLGRRSASRPILPREVTPVVRYMAIENALGSS